MEQSTTWFTHEAGAREVIAVGTSFSIDPEPDVADPDLAATWGELSIWVGGRNVCGHRVHDEEHDAVRWHLLSVLEWLAANWDPLLHEGRLPEPNNGIDAAQGMAMISARLPLEEVERFSSWQHWWQRHCLRAAADGGLFPNLYIRRKRSSIEVSWDSRVTEYAPDGFAFLDDAGHDIVSPSEAREALWRTLDACTEALTNRFPESDRLGLLRHTTLALRDATRTDQRCALIAGMGTEPKQMIERWTEATAMGYGSNKARQAAFGAEHDELVVSGSGVAAVMFGSLAPTVRDEDVRLVVSLLLNQYPAKPPTQEFSDLVDDEEAPGSLVDAWQQGYELAEDVHADLAIDVERFIDVEDIIRRLGVDLKRVHLTDPGVRGMSLWSPEHTPTIIVNRDFSHGESIGVQRFTIAHELCHLLYDRENGSDVAVASGAWAPADLERRANAFAAMFLMPRAFVQRAVGSASASPSTVRGAQEVIDRLKLPATTVLHHLCNLGFIDDGAREALFERLRIDAAWE